MKKYIAAMALLSIVLMAGCSGNASSQPESGSQTDEPTAEVVVTSATSAAPTEQPEELPDTEAVPEQTETTTAVQTEPPQETTAAENPGNYIADWIYGTWSMVSANGQEYWDFAFENGLTEQSQLEFNSEEVLVRNGNVGVELEYNYAITDAGADIYYSWGEKIVTLIYDPSADTLTMVYDGDEAGNVAVYKRGEYPQSTGLDYIADWIYGTWEVISIDGQEYWDDEDQKLEMTFTANGVDVTRNGEVLVTMSYRITDEGAELRDTDGAVYPAVYSPADDTLTILGNGYTEVAKRVTDTSSN